MLVARESATYAAEGLSDEIGSSGLTDLGPSQTPAVG